MVGWWAEPLAVGTGKESRPVLGLRLEHCPLPLCGLAIPGPGQRLQSSCCSHVMHGACRGARSPWSPKSPCAETRPLQVSQLSCSLVGETHFRIDHFGGLEIILLTFREC